MQRIRITYSRTNPLRYTGHLDMQTVWERTIRRARLPLMYSQGFHPQPRINQACPLPLGMTSQMEVLDFWLDPGSTLEAIQEQLSLSLPPGIEITSLVEEDLRSPSLQTQVASAIFHVTFLIPFNSKQLAANVNDVLSSTTLPRIRREKAYDLRPLIYSLDILQTSDPALPHLSMHLAARDGATGRPEEVISALSFDPLDTRIERICLLFQNQ